MDQGLQHKVEHTESGRREAENSLDLVVTEKAF